MFKVLTNAVKIAHMYIGFSLKEGGVAVDATAGNGYDTLFLAKLVGKNGRVYSFDIQEQAINNTSDLLKKEGCSDVVTLFHTGHENMKQLVHEPVDAIVFNLGYLPGGDHKIITTPSSTLTAVADGISLLRPGGIMCIVVYTGHHGGHDEQNLIEAYLQNLGKKDFCIGKFSFINREKAPFVLIVEKTLGGSVVENSETAKDN